MKRMICLCLIVVFIICTGIQSSAYTPQNSHSYRSSDDTGIYSVSFSGSHADIIRYSSRTYSANVDLRSSIQSVCAYRGKIILLCEDVRRTQLSVYVYYLDTDYLDSFVISSALLNNNTDYGCDNDAFYIENYRDDHELLAFSYSGAFLGRYRLGSEINAVFGGYRSGLYAVGGSTLYSLSSGRFNAMSGDSVETPLFPADSHVLVSDYGTVFHSDGNSVSELFSVDADGRASAACVIGNTLYYPYGRSINAYDLDTGERIAYYQVGSPIDSLYADGGSLIAVGDSDYDTVRQADFISLIESDNDPDDGDGSDADRQDAHGYNSGNDSHYSGDSVRGFDESNHSITSDVYQVDSSRYYISGLSPQTTVAAFKKNMDYSGYSLTIYRNSNVKKSGNVGTAMTAVFSSDEYTFTYELAVTGDITGEGSRNSRDMTVLLDYLIGSSDFNGIYTIAADLTNDGKVDVCDAASLKSMI